MEAEKVSGTKITVAFDTDDGKVELNWHFPFSQGAPNTADEKMMSNLMNPRAWSASSMGLDGTRKIHSAIPCYSFNKLKNNNHVKKSTNHRRPYHSFIQFQDKAERKKKKSQLTGQTNKTLHQLKSKPHVFLEYDESVNFYIAPDYSHPDLSNVGNYIECTTSEDICIANTKDERSNKNDVELELSRMFGDELDKSSLKVTQKINKTSLIKQRRNNKLRKKLIQLFGDPLDDIDISKTKKNKRRQIKPEDRRLSLPVSISLENHVFTPLKVCKKRSSEGDAASIPFKLRKSEDLKFTTIEYLKDNYLTSSNLIIPPIYSERATETVIQEEMHKATVLSNIHLMHAESVSAVPACIIDLTDDDVEVPNSQFKSQTNSHEIVCKREDEVNRPTPPSTWFSFTPSQVQPDQRRQSTGTIQPAAVPTVQEAVITGKGRVQRNHSWDVQASQLTNELQSIFKDNVDKSRSDAETPVTLHISTTPVKNLEVLVENQKSSSQSSRQPRLGQMKSYSNPKNIHTQQTSVIEQNPQAAQQISPGQRQRSLDMPDIDIIMAQPVTEHQNQRTPKRQAPSVLDQPYQQEASKIKAAKQQSNSQASSSEAPNTIRSSNTLNVSSQQRESVVKNSFDVFKQPNYTVSPVPMQKQQQQPKVQTVGTEASKCQGKSRKYDPHPPQSEASKAKQDSSSMMIPINVTSNNPPQQPNSMLRQANVNNNNPLPRPQPCSQTQIQLGSYQYQLDEVNRLEALKRAALAARNIPPQQFPIRTQHYVPQKQAPPQLTLLPNFLAGGELLPSCIIPVDNKKCAERLSSVVLKIERWRISINKYYSDMKDIFNPVELKEQEENLRASQRKAARNIAQQLLSELTKIHVENFIYEDVLKEMKKIISKEIQGDVNIYKLSLSLYRLLKEVDIQKATPFVRRFINTVRVTSEWMLKRSEQASVLTEPQMRQLVLQIQQYWSIQKWLLERRHEFMATYQYNQEIIRQAIHRQTQSQNNQAVPCQTQSQNRSNLTLAELLKTAPGRIANNSPAQQNGQGSNNTQQTVQTHRASSAVLVPQNCPVNTTSRTPAIVTTQNNSDSVPNGARQWFHDIHVVPQNNPQNTISNCSQAESVPQKDRTATPVSSVQNQKVSISSEDFIDLTKYEDFLKQPIKSSELHSISVKSEVCVSEEDTKILTSCKVDKKEVIVDNDVIDLTWVDDADDSEILQEVDEFKAFPIKIEESVPADSPREVISPTDSGLGSPVAHGDDVGFKCLCGSKATYVCRCNLSMYCSVDCQNKDWQFHQRLCKSHSECNS